MIKKQITYEIKQHGKNFYKVRCIKSFKFFGSIFLKLKNYLYTDVDRNDPEFTIIDRKIILFNTYVDAERYISKLRIKTETSEFEKEKSKLERDYVVYEPATETFRSPKV
ncbi:gp49 [Sphingomonas phage PAU]|uniref:gp49 n=1 Tax=Sphingomonas phage PAU TaxID=1150991 RepID=UPI0002573136|nr:gp49 [Sphingomonas phage PAU]AFF28047.1 gp49 [Sphingomonas phage PAU]